LYPTLSRPLLINLFPLAIFFSSASHPENVSAFWEIRFAAAPLFRAFILRNFISQSQALPLFLNVGCDDSPMTYITHDNSVGILDAPYLDLFLFIIILVFACHSHCKAVPWLRILQMQRCTDALLIKNIINQMNFFHFSVKTYFSTAESEKKGLMLNLHFFLNNYFIWNKRTQKNKLFIGLFIDAFILFNFS